MAGSESSNEQLAKYLDAYLEDENAPPFAVLVKGQWGIGKTHFIKETLKVSPHLGDQHNWTYVSLNGLTTSEEIDRSLASAIAPFLDNQLAKVVGRVATVAARYFKIDPEIKLSDVVSKIDSKLYVFDDLERFAGDKLVALGYINEFVERYGKKVIIISNAEKIEDAEFDLRKEKTIGKELEFQPHPASLVASYVKSHLELPKGVDAEPQIKLIVDIFVGGKVDNLRALRHAVWDYSRLVKSLDKKHAAHSKFLLALGTAFFPVAFDHRLKRLSDRDIADIGSQELAGIVETDPPSPWLAFEERYREFDVNLKLLSSTVWHRLLVEGIVDDTELREAIDRTEFFRAGNRPSWRRLWSGEKETPEDMEDLYKDMRSRIDAHEYDNPDEVLHVFGVLIWLATFGVGGRTPQQVLEEGKRYIDKLRADARLTPYSEKLRVGQEIFSRGIGYKEGDKPAFLTLQRYMVDQREEVARRALPAIAEELLGLISTDLGKFVGSINFNDFDDGRYIRTPLLHHIPPRKFLDAVMALTPEEQQRALSAVSLRYKNGELNADLGPEEPWLREVSAMLQEDAAKMSGFATLRRREYAIWYFERTLADYQKAIERIAREENDE